MARQVREGRPGFSTGLPALTKRDRHPCRSPCGPDRPPLTAAQGPREGSSGAERRSSHRRESRSQIWLGQFGLGFGCWRAALALDHRGGLSFGYFSLATQRKV